jgi:hypothetical protein
VPTASFGRSSDLLPLGDPAGAIISLARLGGKRVPH